MTRALGRLAAGAALAVSLLTVVPVRARTEPAGLGAAAAWFPAVGALVGLGAGGVWLAADEAVGAGVAGGLAVAWLVGFTGALHLDGLADCADALGVRGGRERRLAVMRESTVGVFGVAVVVLWALLLALAIAALPHDDALPTLVVAGTLGRWAAVLQSVAMSPARPDGLGAAFSATRTAVAVATAAAIIAAVTLASVDGLAACLAALAVAAGVAAWARRALGGRTGDTLGAAIALTELTVVLVLLAFARH